jgi:methylated-DNA-protein-cysteine methyltransferase-like protein
VASYHLVAITAGYPRTARFVGRALQVSRGLPWWRVLGADGSLRIMNPELRREQFDRLMAEGVPLDAKGRVDLERYGWRPRVTKARAPSRSPLRRPP